MLLHNCLGHIRLDQLQLAWVCNPKGRLQPDRLEIIAHDIQAEAVDCSNLRIMHKRILPLQARMIRLQLHTFFNRAADTFTHFCCRCFCKSNNQHTVNIYRMRFVQYLG